MGRLGPPSLPPSEGDDGEEQEVHLLDDEDLHSHSHSHSQQQQQRSLRATRKRTAFFDEDFSSLLAGEQSSSSSSPKRLREHPPPTRSQDSSPPRRLRQADSMTPPQSNSQYQYNGDPLKIRLASASPKRGLGEIMHSSTTPSPSHSPGSSQRPNRNGRPAMESSLRARKIPFAQRDPESEGLEEAEEEEHDESHIDVVGETSSAEEDHHHRGAEAFQSDEEMLEEDDSSEEGVASRSHWEKDYKHEEVFPQLHTRMSLPLVSVDKKRRVLIPSYHPAKGSIPSYLARPIDLDRVPKPSFRVLTSPLPPSSGSSKKDSPHSKKRVSFDTHPMDIFHEPGNSDDPTSPYQRFVLPSMAHYDRVVEYDMDEHDFAWLEIYNEERKKANLPEISEDVFELLVDRIEKEWYSYSQTQKSRLEATSEVVHEDSPCDVCQQTECEPGNAIVFCDGCNIAVHQDCYGVPYIPDGPWHCRKCFLVPEKNVKCIFCPKEGGAMKQTMDNRWAHVLCAFWIPEVGFANQAFLEPIDSIEAIPKDRWRLTCFICKNRVGACIQCSKPNCMQAYHITCARSAGLHCVMKDMNTPHAEFTSFCDKHTPKMSRSKTASPVKPMTSLLGSVNDLRDPLLDLELVKKRIGRPPLSETAAKKKPKDMLPIIPTHLFHRLINTVNPYHIQKKAQFVATVCKYWSLKRQNRRGTPLLKRLHIQSHSARSAVVADLTPEQLKIKSEHIWALRENLDKSRTILEAVCKRETFKIQQLRVQYNIVNLVCNPLGNLMNTIYERISSFDRKRVFAFPVSPTEVPDYLEVIKHPMDFSTMKQKLKDGAYETWGDFEADIKLIWANAMVYNRPDTIFFKSAFRLQAAAEPLLEDAVRVIAESRVDSETGVLVDPLPLNFFSKLDLAPRSAVRRRNSEETLKGKAVEHAGTSDSHEESEDGSGDSDAEMSGHSILSFLDFGQKVNAKWTNGQYYAATVCQVNRESNTVEVVFDDGVRLDVSVDDVNIIPSELIVSGSARRLRSVDAKLKEEMKSLSSPLPASKQTLLNFPPNSAPPNHQVQPQIMSPEKRVAAQTSDSSSPRRLRTPAKSPHLSMPKRLPNGRFVSSAAGPIKPPVTVTTTAPAPSKSRSRAAAPLLWPPMSLFPPPPSPGMWAWGKTVVQGVETWFPAEIVDPADPDIPVSFSKQAAEMKKQGKCLVHYIEGGGARSWGWHYHGRLLRFGTAKTMRRRIEKLDDQAKNLVIQAYEEALKHVGAEEGDEGDHGDAEDGGD